MANLLFLTNTQTLTDVITKTIIETTIQNETITATVNQTNTSTHSHTLTEPGVTATVIGVNEISATVYEIIETTVEFSFAKSEVPVSLFGLIMLPVLVIVAKNISKIKS